MSQEPIYAKGLFANPRLETAPDFLICRLSFKTSDFKQKKKDPEVLILKDWTSAYAS